MSAAVAPEPRRRPEGSPSTKNFYDDGWTEAHAAEDQDVGLGGLPSETQMVLLCLDYLRDLRRAYHDAPDLAIAEGIDADYLSIAIYALSRCFLKPPQLCHHGEAGNDPWLDRIKAEEGVFPIQDDAGNKKIIPDIASINKEILYSRNPVMADAVSSEVDKDQHHHDDPSTWYDYNDAHLSNSHRFYPLDGLASGPTLRGPLNLGEIAAAGLLGLGARSRLDAERDMVQSTLFEQFVSAVRAKGFFGDSEPTAGTKSNDPKAAETYEERYRKVVAKFRTKLAHKAQEEAALPHGDSGETQDVPGYIMAQTVAGRQRRRRNKRRHEARLNRPDVEDNHQTPTSRGGIADVNRPQPLSVDINDPSSSLGVTTPGAKSSLWPISPVTAPSVTTIQENNPVDLEEAERLKATGNQHMQKKQYQEAADSYTAALKLSPAGPHSHVYFSNRAAALLSMKQFHEAINDSERSLALKADYGKAHSRLGLAYFLLGNFKQAVEAYTVSLKYEPNNKSSMNYLEKARKRLAAQEMQEAAEGDDAVGGGSGAKQRAQDSFSVVSEWEKTGVSPVAVTTPVAASTPLPPPAGEAKDVQKEAEKFKHRGNSHMASREYQLALDAYSEAIDLSPAGPTSHVYFSNRAAALCYLERYEEAEVDSARSLALKPSYGKAHARLGLSRFFMGDYEGAVEAYTAALEYDPDNAASKSYLAKAYARLERMQSQDDDEHEEEATLEASVDFSSPPPPPAPLPPRTPVEQGIRIDYTPTPPPGTGSMNSVLSTPEASPGTMLADMEKLSETDDVVFQDSSQHGSGKADPALTEHLKENDAEVQRMAKNAMAQTADPASMVVEATMDVQK